MCSDRGLRVYIRVVDSEDIETNSVIVALLVAYEVGCMPCVMSASLQWGGDTTLAVC